MPKEKVGDSDQWQKCRGNFDNLNTNTAQHLLYMSHFRFSPSISNILNMNMESTPFQTPHDTSPSPAPSRYNPPIQPDESQESIADESRDINPSAY